ncbi:hypothetical protein B0A79_11995 [Flavobacterium piscis]|jgi:hypothetical protein|uniref:Redox-active disulfide protein 2 n=1 Tax=Flavobacterium piscis TaxID=1114874 RepID=A0ABX2XIV8_9FLAO|nr:MULTISPECIES: hypothetical protein [Flavobacterium]MCA1918887.1 hypothetical protein [Flavobacterium piscis]OCB73873.1 hypothetical protein FLP_14490 [Flavobacterium piscis]OXG04365.1 hypothetical protein B0A79_11995 [Flavobacterium piscis]QDW21857.1 hypothetical protein B0M43_0017625 [Flavobacterium sp. KBS0721]
MKKNIYEELTNEKLIKKRDLFKGVSIGFGVIFLLAIGIIVYILSVKGLKNVSIATFIPIFILPITFIPMLINLSLLNKEIKSRNL